MNYTCGICQEELTSLSDWIDHFDAHTISEAKTAGYQVTKNKHKPQIQLLL